jgi:hypothetical protein
MNESVRELVRRLREEHEREQAKLSPEEREHQRALVVRLHREAAEQARTQPPPPPAEPRGVHYTELSEAKPGEPFADEWNTYRREVGCLLDAGQEGRFVVIKGREILGVYETWDEARDAGLKRYPLESFFTKQIQTREPFLRVRGYNFPWPS